MEAASKELWLLTQTPPTLHFPSGEVILFPSLVSSPLGWFLREPKSLNRPESYNKPTISPQAETPAASLTPSSAPRHGFQEPGRHSTGVAFPPSPPCPETRPDKAFRPPFRASSLTRGVLGGRGASSRPEVESHEAKPRHEQRRTLPLPPLKKKKGPVASFVRAETVTPQREKARRWTIDLRKM